MKYQDFNSHIIDEWVKNGWQWGKPITSEEFENAKKGNWQVFLTPTKAVPKDWFGNLMCKKILGLASGGAQQMPVFSALGAECSVLDYSDSQLQSEKLVAKREGYDINIIKGDMTKKLPFDNDSFDLIFHPVSNDYVEKVEPIFAECYRILKKGGVIMCGLGNGVNYIVDEKEEKIIYSLPFNPLINEEHKKILMKENAGYQFSHTVGEQLNAQLEAGFILTHVLDDTNGEGRLHELNIPTYMLTRAIKI